ncbi:MAG: phage tail protein [Burkholderiales bacterium RIFCSPLOWO2_02_FULL_57_36]|nr:MAG: phage tail protein [Burkholderiales bacterium RIFCSPLOWO2_02_FULL_57_36]
MGQYKTPGVYVVEKNAFPNSVVEVATAVPAFIGYTAIADNKGSPLTDKSWRITSMAEFESYFGGAPMTTFTIGENAEKSGVDADFSVFDATAKKSVDYVVGKTAGKHLLYYSMKLFFQNGGGACHVVSVGKHGADIDPGKLTKGIEVLLKEQEPTMVVIPEAMLLSAADCATLQQNMLMHCGFKMKNRFAILDVYDGYKDRQDPSGDVINAFRESVGTNFLGFGAAYYPWVNSTVVALKDVDFTHLTNVDKLQALLTDELSPVLKPAVIAPGMQTKIDQITKTVADIGKDWSAEPNATQQIEILNNTLMAISPLYSKVLLAMQRKLNLLPPSAAMAGLYTMVDNTRGVWKAPANVSLVGVTSPIVNITHDDQEDLNVTTQGKSVNAIRSFIGEGTLVWGARTLDGNSLDWRYINVRRTMIMLEESLRLASKAYVFEPNVANTWITIKSMARNFLTGIWKRGGLAGASPEDAFSVSVGLNETMTADDILEGILRVTVLVAISRPAEFIEITFQQQMQKS